MRFDMGNGYAVELERPITCGIHRLVPIVNDRCSTCDAPASQLESWFSPNGVEHRQPIGRPCVTCGRKHDLFHFVIVKRRGEDPRACAVRRATWPYECVAKDKNPDHAVYVCDTHGCWWHEAS